jgi:hypothetical protein
MPESESLQIKLTTTLESFQPAPFAGGETEAVITGGVLSRLTVAAAVAVFPATSVAIP